MSSDEIFNDRSRDSSDDSSDDGSNNGPFSTTGIIVRRDQVTTIWGRTTELKERDIHFIKMFESKMDNSHFAYHIEKQINNTTEGEHIFPYAPRDGKQAVREVAEVIIHDQTNGLLPPRRVVGKEPSVGDGAAASRRWTCSSLCRNVTAKVGKNVPICIWQLLAVPNEVKAILPPPTTTTVHCSGPDRLSDYCLNDPTAWFANQIGYPLYWTTSQKAGPGRRLSLEQEALDTWEHAYNLTREDVKLNVTFAELTENPELQLWYVTHSPYNLNQTGWWEDVTLSYNESTVTQTMYLLNYRIGWKLALGWDMPPIPEHITSVGEYLSGSGLPDKSATMKSLEKGNTLLKIRNVTWIGPYDGGGPYRFNTCIDKTGTC